MALPYARAALIKYVTDVVLENVTKQLARSAPRPDMAALQAAQPDVAAVIGSLNSSLTQLRSELAALEERLERVDRRMTRLEKRWGWTTMIRIVVGVAVAFILGFGMAQLLRLGGWMG